MCECIQRYVVTVVALCCSERRYGINAAAGPKHTTAGHYCSVLRITYAPLIIAPIARLI